MSGKLLNVLIDETPVNVELGYTIIQTCASAGVEIPRFCYHDKLLIAGNCRICLVEIAGSKKLVASCAVHVTNNMIIYSNTARVRLARQNVLEFLLANHPLDCPICDQGGECDLQDITAVFGADRGRFYEVEKRAVLNKDFGPLIRTSMNRCIHCTRCVRFLSLSSGFAILGTVGRGSSTEISTYVSQFISDELSGNVVDLCPVGALTSKPYSFKARPWELTSVESFDVLDTINSSIMLDVAANKISRVLPYANEALNECWLSNRARYAYDGLFVQRLSSCLLKTSFSFFSEKLVGKVTRGFYVKLSWSSAVLVLLEKLTKNTLSTLLVGLGDSFDLGSAVLAKTFFTSFGAAIFSADPYLSDSSDFSFLYLFNTSLEKVSKLPTFCLLVGTNTRLEAPLLNLRLNKLVTAHGTPIYRIGVSATYLTFKTKYLANSSKTFFQITEFKHIFCKNFYISLFGSYPFILIGQSMLAKFGETTAIISVIGFLARIAALAPFPVFAMIQSFNFSSFGVLNTYSSRIHVSDTGFYAGVSKVFQINALNPTLTSNYLGGSVLFYSLGLDLLSIKDVVTRTQESDVVWTVYQGTHGNGVASVAHLILPTLTYVESTMIYKNLIGLVRKSVVAVSYNFSAKTGAEIFKMILTFIGNQPRFNFINLNFFLSISFNWMLIATAERLLSSTFLTPWSFGRSPLVHVGHTFNAEYHYLHIYKIFGSVSSIRSVDYLAQNFYTRLLQRAGSVKIADMSLSSTVLNYYGDQNLVLLGASKTMNLCSNLVLKKNLSFNTLYY